MISTADDDSDIEASDISKNLFLSFMLVRLLPSDKLSIALKRAVFSIVLNIAEGNGRISLKERARFFYIARASANEVSSIFDLAYNLVYIDKSKFDEIQDSLLQIIKNALQT